MGRKRQGWTLRQRTKGGVYYARFTIDGRPVERSTGTADPRAGAREAARIYAAEVTAERKRPPKPKRSHELELEVLVAQWLVWLTNTHAESTRELWELYATTHWLPFFGSTHNVTNQMLGEYMRARLAVVLSTTVRKELTALRSFVGWAMESGALSPGIVVPTLPKRVPGKAFDKRRRSPAIALSPEQVAAIIDALPEWSTSRKRKIKFPVRARFIVAYETSLRPSTLDRMLAPLHYRKGSDHIHVTVDIDKARWARDVPLSPRARKALDRVVPDAGPVFGKHDYRDQLRQAVKLALPPALAERFAGAHLRSAALTHWGEQPGANVVGMQFMAGHKRLSTTAGYIRPSRRAAEQLIRAQKR